APPRGTAAAPPPAARSLLRSRRRAALVPRRVGAAEHLLHRQGKGPARGAVHLDLRDRELHRICLLLHLPGRAALVRLRSRLRHRPFRARLASGSDPVRSVDRHPLDAGVLRKERRCLRRDPEPARGLSVPRRDLRLVLAPLPPDRGGLLPAGLLRGGLSEPPLSAGYFPRPRNRARRDGGRARRVRSGRAASRSGGGRGTGTGGRSDLIRRFPTTTPSSSSRTAAGSSSTRRARTGR